MQCRSQLIPKQAVTVGGTIIHQNKNDAVYSILLLLLIITLVRENWLTKRNRAVCTYRCVPLSLDLTRLKIDSRESSENRKTTNHRINSIHFLRDKNSFRTHGSNHAVTYRVGHKSGATNSVKFNRFEKNYWKISW